MGVYSSHLESEGRGTSKNYPNFSVSLVNLLESMRVVGDILQRRGLFNFLPDNRF